MSKQVYFKVDKVRELMAEKQISEEQLAEKMGKSVATVKKLLNGDQSNVMLLTLIQLGKALDVDFRTLLIDDK